jgi:hypothetical protein
MAIMSSSPHNKFLAEESLIRGGSEWQTISTLALASNRVVPALQQPQIGLKNVPPPTDLKVGYADAGRSPSASPVVSPCGGSDAADITKSRLQRDWMTSPGFVSGGYLDNWPQSQSSGAM